MRVADIIKEITKIAQVKEEVQFIEVELDNL